MFQKDRADSLPEKFQCELNLPGRRGRAGNSACCARDPGGCKHDEIRCIEISSVQQIEELSAKLKRKPLADGGVLERRKVPGGESRSDQGVPAEVAVESAVGWGWKKRAGIEPLRRIADGC